MFSIVTAPTATEPTAKRSRLPVVIGIAAGVLVIVAAACTQCVRTSDCQTAQPIELPGVPNCHKVSQYLYRGGQPTAEGMRSLKKLGIKTIVNLRTFHSDRDETGVTGLACEHVHMQAWDGDLEDIVRFLRIATDGTRGPVFVHCQHGADRTGVACAAYRIAVQGWSKDRAIDEMVNGGYGFHSIWGNLVTFVRRLDADYLKRQLAR